MAVVSNADTKRMYSWWWDSHISPKNSKWLQENLTDMDSKVKQMIKLIEEDADSFARRAEMYYKKRPELMKLVEEFYRAYRALAERYHHATGVIRHAQRTMPEVFPNQVPQTLIEDLPVGSSTTESDPRTPEMQPPVCAFADPDELQKDALGVSSHPHGIKRNGGFTEEPYSVTTSRGLKQLNDLFEVGNGRARKGLNFNDTEYKGSNAQNNGSHDLKARTHSESERVSQAEAEILALKNALKSLESEKGASLHEYEKNLERLSALESEVSCAQENSKGLNERASKAEAEVETLKEALNRLESEREATQLQYQQCLQKIADMENSITRTQMGVGEVTERARKAESEARAMRQELARVEAEKDAAFVKYKQCLETVSNLEEKLVHAEEESSSMKERAEKAEGEIETLKQTISELTEEKEASSLRYQQCLDTIADLKLQLIRAQDEVQRLKREIEDGSAKLKVSEEKCEVLERSNQTLHSELDSLMEKLGSQSQELTEKQKELGRLWTSIQEERLRFLEAETAFQTLQHLHSQSQEELRSLAAELQIRVQILKDVETRNSDLQAEVQIVKEENKGLSELNLSSAQSIRSLQEEILSLRGTIKKLETEVEMRVDQRNALQQEIYCLKEEMNDISKRHQAMMQQVEAVNLDPDCFESSVKELQVENSNVKEAREKEKGEKLALLDKLEIMEKLVEKNALLETSISDLSAELEAARGKVNALEEACQSILEEKSILVSEKDELISRLQIATEKSEKASEKNKFLENSLSDANVELEGLRTKLKGLEDSFLLLEKENSGLVAQRESLESQVEVARKNLDTLDTGHKELMTKYRDLETERVSTLQTVEELRISLDAKDQEYATFIQLNENKMTDMELHIRHLQNESQCREKEYQLELERSLEAQVEIFVLQKCAQEMEENIFSLMVDYENVKETAESFEKLVSDLKNENHGQHLQIESLTDRVKKLRNGLHQVLKKLPIHAELGSENLKDQDQRVLHKILGRLQEMGHLLSESQDGNQKSMIENSVLIALIHQLLLEAEDVAKAKSILDQEFRLLSEHLTVMKCEVQMLKEINEELRSKVKEGDHKEEVLKTEREYFLSQILDLQVSYKDLQEVHCNTLDEKKSLINLIVCLEEEKQKLEEELCLVIGESIARDSLSVALKDIISDRLLEVKELSNGLTELLSIKNGLEDKMVASEDQINCALAENSQLKKSLEVLESKLLLASSARDQITGEVENVKDLLYQNEKELSRTGEMLAVVQGEKRELYAIVEDLKLQYNKVKATQEEQGKKILKLEHECNDRIRENGHVSEVNQKLELELQKLLEEHNRIKQEKEALGYELTECRNENESWEFQAAEMLCYLLVSTLREALLEENTREFLQASKSLEDRITFKEAENGQLKERILTLERENDELKAQMGSYNEGIASLNGSIRTLENHIFTHDKLNDSVAKDANNDSSGAEGDPQVCQDRQGQGSSGVPTLPDMHLRIKAIKEAVLEMERLSILEKAKVGFELESAMMRIKELKSASSRSSSKRTKHLNTNKHSSNLRQQRERREISEEESEMMTKDIMLDQASECSSYSVSRRGTQEVDDQELQSWDIPDQSGSIDLNVEKAAESTNPSSESKRRSPSVESLIEKELGVDKLEISSSCREGTKRKILERLDSDLQKLTNLKITVQDLKSKVVDEKGGKKGNGEDFETVKDQLDEAEEAITKLFDVNRRLVNKVEDGFVSLGGESSDLNDTGSARRRRISEQARRGSEKIGRLQLEVQRIQFLLLKLNGEKESRAKARIPERKTRTLLRDYIYGGMRSKQKKKKKAPFCGCVEPRSP